MTQLVDNTKKYYNSPTMRRNSHSNSPVRVQLHTDSEDVSTNESNNANRLINTQPQARPHSKSKMSISFSGITRPKKGPKIKKSQSETDKKKENSEEGIPNSISEPFSLETRSRSATTSAVPGLVATKCFSDSPVSYLAAQKNLCENLKLSPRRMAAANKKVSFTKEVKKDPRELVIQEIVQTEKDYIDDLKLLVKLYVKPLRGEEPVAQLKHTLNRKQTRTIFSNIEVLVNLNQQFLTDLTEQIQRPFDSQMIGNCFLNIGDYLKIYAEYCTNQKIALDLIAYFYGETHDAQTTTTFQMLDMTKEQVASFNSYCKYARLLPESKGLDLESFLIKPVQRVCKYPLFLRELERVTDPNHPDFPSLQKAHQIICGSVQKINDLKVSFLLRIYLPLF